MLGTINIAVEAATNLTSSIHAFNARISVASQRLRSVEDKSSALSNVLQNINGLVKRQAEREGISIVIDGNTTVLLDGDRGGVEGDECQGKEKCDVLNKQCFKELSGASRGATNRLNAMTEKINAATGITPLASVETTRTSKQHEQTKAILTEVDRERLFLRENDIELMENNIEGHKLEVQINFIVFQAVL